MEPRKAVPTERIIRIGSWRTPEGSKGGAAYNIAEQIDADCEGE
jgi:hypothetical protein